MDGMCSRAVCSFDIPKALINRAVPRHFPVVICSGYKRPLSLSHRQFTLIIGQASAALGSVAGELLEKTRHTSFAGCSVQVAGGGPRVSYTPPTSHPPADRLSDLCRPISYPAGQVTGVPGRRWPLSSSVGMDASPDALGLGLRRSGTKDESPG